MYFQTRSILVERGGGCFPNGDVGRWECEATSSCIPFTDQCVDENGVGTCWQDIDKCADKCIPPGLKKGFYECTADNGEKQCLSATEKCNGQCGAKEDDGDDFVECGQICIPPGELNVKYKDCYGNCIPNSRDCIGKSCRFYFLVLTYLLLNPKNM